MPDSQRNMPTWLRDALVALGASGIALLGSSLNAARMLGTLDQQVAQNAADVAVLKSENINAEIATLKGMDMELRDQLAEIRSELQGGNFPMSIQAAASIEAINRHLEATDERVQALERERRSR